MYLHMGIGYECYRTQKEKMSRRKSNSKDSKIIRNKNISGKYCQNECHTEDTHLNYSE